jgi:RecB family endonuclease NucS
MLFENDSGDMFVVELKLGKIGREAINQLRRYLKLLKKETNKKVKGILVCSGVMQTFQDEFARLRDISIFRYGWQMKVSPWPDK